jgi:hypothetical protein
LTWNKSVRVVIVVIVACTVVFTIFHLSIIWTADEYTTERNNNTDNPDNPDNPDTK